MIMVFDKIKKEANKKSIIWIILIVIVVILITLNLIPVVYDEFEIESTNSTEARTTCFRNCTTHKFNLHESDDKFICECKKSLLRSFISSIF